MARQVAIYPKATPEQMTALALAVNGVIAGETLNTGTFTAGAGDKAVRDPRCRAGRVAMLVPLNADAASMTWYLSSMTRGEMTFTLAGSGTGSWAWLIFGS
nr:MAG TPA: hypothetical protein [Caudoviricetes sp.]